MKKAILLLGLGLIGFGLGAYLSPFQKTDSVETSKESAKEPAFWGDRYIEDNCRRCPECCVEIPDQ